MLKAAYLGIQILQNPVTLKKVLSCVYGIGEWEMEDWIDSFMTQGVSLSL
jgi:uncharacterized protein (DUF2062 family)